MTLYEILGVPTHATDKEVKTAYRSLAKTHHPDTGGSPEQFQKIAHAYEVLSDPERRQRYNETGYDGSQPDNSGAALHTMMSVFDRAISTAEAQGRLELSDLIAMARRFLQDDMRAGQRGTASLRRQIATHEQVLSRLKFKGDGEDFLSRQLRDTIERVKADIASNDLKIQVLTEAGKLLDAYSYECVQSWSPPSWDSPVAWDLAAAERYMKG